MRNLVAMAVGKRLQKTHEEMATELPDDIKQALARLQRLRRRPSWQRNRYPRPVRRWAKLQRVR